MYLERLTLRQFRNLTRADLDWGSGFNVIWGRNAQGKTNLLEAIYLLGHLKSFRSARGCDLIAHDREQAWLGASVQAGQVNYKIDLALEMRGRTPRVNGKTVRKLSQFLGHLRPILFTPEEMGLVKGYPAGRRALLDRAVLQVDPIYLDRVQEYERILKQRNQLLKERAGTDELRPWTEALIQGGSRIRKDRLDYLQRFEPIFNAVYREISGGDEQVAIAYPERGLDLIPLQERLAEQLRQQRSRELQLGQTLSGPHRDDPEFLLDGRPLRLFGSQGQQRSFLLAFKAAQVVDLEQALGEPPVLLLDDLASELDQDRQAGFFDYLLARKGQVFITTTQPASLADSVNRTARHFRVEAGSVVENSPG